MNSNEDLRCLPCLHSTAAARIQHVAAETRIAKIGHAKLELSSTTCRTMTRHVKSVAISLQTMRRVGNAHSVQRKVMTDAFRHARESAKTSLTEGSRSVTPDATTLTLTNGENLSDADVHASEMIDINPSTLVFLMNAKIIKFFGYPVRNQRSSDRRDRANQKRNQKPRLKRRRFCDRDVNTSKLTSATNGVVANARITMRRYKRVSQMPTELLRSSGSDAWDSVFTNEITKEMLNISASTASRRTLHILTTGAFIKYDFHGI